MSKELSILIPCLNEEKTIAQCIKQAKESCDELKIPYEIIVIDNGSIDSSIKKATKAGAIVISESKQGYGHAYKKGVQKSNGKYLFLADGDGTYDFSYIKKFYRIAKHRKCDFVMGKRIPRKGAMSSLRKIGNKILSGILRILFGSEVHDTHSGMRLILKEKIDKMQLQSTGFEYAIEMVIKAAKQKLKTKEVLIPYSKRQSQSKLHPLKDGWRHIRFMIVFSPTAVFFMPGLLFLILGLVGLGTPIYGPINIGTIAFTIHPLFIGSILTILGLQIIITGYYARTYAIAYLKEQDTIIEKIQKFITLEKGLVVGGIIILASIILTTLLYTTRIKAGFSEIESLPLLIILGTLFVIGVQIIFNAFYFISIQMSK